MKFGTKLERLLNNDNEPACNDKYIKTKITSYERKVNTIFFLSCQNTKKVANVFAYQ